MMNNGGVKLEGKISIRESCCKQNLAGTISFESLSHLG